MSTLQDMFKDRDRMLHEHALWTEVKEHLSKFLDGDATPAKVGITSRAGGVVPQDIIMEVQFQVDSTLDQLQREITVLEGTEVAKNEPQAEEKQQGEPKTARAKGAKAGK